MDQEDFFSNNSSATLQSNFQTFLSEKRRQFREKAQLQKSRASTRDTPEYIEALRTKFVQTAMSYIGVPYAKRYHEPGSDGYNSPIFLDCCALVRQAVDDLKEDFGFKIGRWNQAYQYDTLGPEIPFESLRTGDLVFYSATYYDSKKRRQIHDMVHVEIFIGGTTGEQSLGARWFKGFVQVFDSYKFVSTNYYDIKFHYKSIDAWLKGSCDSLCPEHPWRNDRGYQWVAHNSIFAEDEEEAEGNDTKESTPGKECEDGVRRDEAEDNEC